MKVCIVTHCVSKGDGQGRVNYEVAKAALQRGHQVILLASDVADELQAHPHLQWLPIKVNQWPTKLLRNSIFAWQSRAWLDKYRSAIDVVKINGAITDAHSDVNAVHFVHNSWLQFSLKEAEATTVKLSKSQALRRSYQRFYTSLNAHWEKSAFQKAKVLVAVSDNVEQDLQALGIPAQSIRVIPNGVDLQEFAPGSCDRQTWNLPERATLALFVGDARTPRKNLDTILHALAQVSAELPDLHLAVAGPTAGTTYPQLAKTLHIEDKVHFLGYRSDIADLMKASDFLVFPSRYETFGLVVIEAMAAGLPVITAATTGASTLVSTDSGVVLANPDDVAALANALRQIGGDRLLRERMGKAARCIAEQHSWQTMAEMYVDLFEELSAS